MIPATHIHDNGDGTMWLIEAALPDSPSGWPATRNDRPCDTCSGTGCVENLSVQYGWDRCPDCHGTRRHVWPIEVEVSLNRLHDKRPGTRTLLVHVIPGVVLPITDGTDAKRYGSYVASLRSGPFLIDRATDTGTPITLPSDAEPGMWAVQLQEVDP